MSYAFDVTADTKASAKAQVAAKFDEVLKSQPIHEADMPAARAAADAMIDVVNEPDAVDQLSVSVSGWVAWKGQAQDPSAFTAANVAVSVRTNPKPAAG